MELGPRQKQWVEDIPKYPQAYGTLCDGYGFCCLGVYAQTQIEADWEISWDNVYRTNGQSGVLPTPESLRLGLHSSTGRFNTLLSWQGMTYRSIAGLNDSQKITPEQLAKFIQDNAEFIFTKSA